MPTAYAYHSRLEVAALLVFGFSGISAAQAPAAPNEAVEAVAYTGDTASESAPFEIEILVFANNAFNPGEEDFSRVRRALVADARPPGVDCAAADLEDCATGAHRLSQQVGNDREGPRADRPSRGEFRYSFLDPSVLTLTAARQRLQRLDAYTVLLHRGWVQQGYSKTDAHDFDLSRLGEPAVGGTLRFHVSRFAHVSTSIHYSPATDLRSHLRSASADGGALSEDSRRKFELRQTRRMRSGELHYFDHPAFGLLVTVRPHRGANELVSSGAPSVEAVSLARP